MQPWAIFIGQLSRQPFGSSRGPVSLASASVSGDDDDGGFIGIQADCGREVTMPVSKEKKEIMCTIKAAKYNERSHEKITFGTYV